MDMNYLFEHLDELLLLAEQQNYSETADALYISQSSLSKHIQIIEKELGAPLFDRTTRRVVLNEFGRVMIPMFPKLRDARDELEEASHRYQKQKTNQVVVNAIPLLDVYQFPQQIARFQKANPEYTVNVIENYETTPLEELRSGKCDLSFCRNDTGDISDLVEVPYAQDHIVAVLSVNHRYARMHSIQLDSLKNDDFVLINQKTSIYKLCVDACKAEGFEPTVIYTSHRIESIVNMVEQSMGVALLTKQQAMMVWRPTLSIVELKPEIKTGISLYYRPSCASEATVKFLEFLRKRAHRDL